MSDLWDFWPTFDQSDEKTWPDQQKYENGERQRQWRIHLENTFKEQSLRLVTFETFDQSDEKNLPDQQKETAKKTKTKTMTNTFENTPKEDFLKKFREQHPQKAILEKFWVCKVLTGSWGCGCIPGSVGLAVKRWGNISSLDERIWNKGKNETWEFVWGSHILDYFWEGKNFRCSDICNTFIWWQLCFWVKKYMSEELVKASKTWN